MPYWDEIDLEQRLAAFFDGHIEGFGEAGAAEDAVHGRDDLLGDLAAELDIHATAGHVGGNGDRSKGACAGDDLRFLGVLAGIQDLMRNTA